jgi:DUF3102 family protein
VFRLSTCAPCVHAGKAPLGLVKASGFGTAGQMPSTGSQTFPGKPAPDSSATPTERNHPTSKAKKMSNLEISNVILFERPASNPAEKTDDRYLRNLAEQVRNHSRSSTKAIIAIGEALRDAKQHLGHGRFGKWVVAECGFTIRSAQNYMRAAELTDKSEIVSRLNPAAIYRLAKASTPPDVVDRVLEILEAGGDAPTEQEILGLIPRNEEAHARGKLIGDNSATVHLARELHSRLGHELVSQLLGSRWPDLRKHLRDTIEQSNQGPTPQARQA